MASTVIQITPKKAFLFDGPTTTGTGLAGVGPRAIMTPDWVSGVLSVRVFSQSMPVGATVNVKVYNVYISPEDPNTTFSASSPIATASITSTTPEGGDPGSLLTQALSTPIGPMLTVVVDYTQGANSGTSNVQISIDLIGRDA